MNYFTFNWIGDSASMYQPGFQDLATTIVKEFYLCNICLLLVMASIVLLVVCLLMTFLVIPTKILNKSFWYCICLLNYVFFNEINVNVIDALTFQNPATLMNGIYLFLIYLINFFLNF